MHVEPRHIKSTSSLFEVPVVPAVILKVRFQILKSQRLSTCEILNIIQHAAPSFLNKIIN